MASISSGVAWAASLPVQRVAEIVANDAAEVARLGLVCRCFRERIWADGGLQTPRMKLWPHTSLATIRHLQFGALRDITVYETSAFFLAGSDGIARWLFASSPSLECLRLQLREECLQTCWASTLRDLAASLGHGESGRKSCATRYRIPPLRTFELDGQLFPPDASDALGYLIKICAPTLCQVRITFDDTAANAPFQDEWLWDGLTHARRLDVLQLVGLRTSQDTCTGLTRVLRAHASSIHSFGLGGHTAAALLRPPSTAQLEALHPTGTPPPELAEEIRSFIYAGSKLRLRTLILCKIIAPELFSPLAFGFGSCAANLAALLTAAVFLAPSLETLDLSGNSDVVNQALPPLPVELLIEAGTEGFDIGHAAMLAILQASYSLTSLDVSGSSLRLGNALTISSVLAKRAHHLVDFKVAGCDMGVDEMAFAVQQRLASGIMTVMTRFEHIRCLDLGRMAVLQPTRRIVMALLRGCAPNLCCLSGTLPVSVIAGAFSSTFATGTCREPVAQNLQALNLSLFEKGSIADFVDVLGANTKTLTSLQLQGLSRRHELLGDAYGVALANALQTAQLTQLTLNLCGLGANSARYIASALGTSRFSRLTCISLSDNTLGLDAGQIIEALMTRSHVRNVRLRRCGLLPQLGALLGRLTMALPYLLLLDLAGNEDFRSRGMHDMLNAAFKEWGRADAAGRHANSMALPGCIDVRECQVDVPGTDVGAVDTSERPLPRQLGRFKIHWDGAIGDAIG